MSFTERYKIMCEKAEEIQKEWVPSPGDMVICRRNIKLDTYDYIREGETTMILDVEWDVLYVGDVSEVICYPECISVPIRECTIDDFVWLPTQEQLQELAMSRGHFDFSLVTLFSCFSRNFEHKFSSLNELWLAFVMIMIYDRCWNDEKQKWEECP